MINRVDRCDIICAHYIINMSSPKPIFVIGIIGLFSLIILFGFTKSIWRASVRPAQRIAISDEQDEKAEDLQTSRGDPLVTPAWKVNQPEVRSTDPVRGAKNAPVTIVEYGDFQCPFCLDVQPELDRVLESYPEIVRIVWKDFPNPLHPEARSAALAARCAQEQGKFWEYHDFLFSNQDQLSRSVYSQIAQKLNLNMTQFDTCLDNMVKIGLIGQGIDEAQTFEIDGTPYFLINGNRLDYAGSFQEFAQLIELAISQAN